MIKITIRITKENSTITISQTILKHQQIQGFLIAKRRLWDDSETPLEGRYRGGGERHFCEYLLFLQVFLQETVAEFLIQVLRNYKCRHILFSPSDPLCVSVSQA